MPRSLLTALASSTYRVSDHNNYDFRPYVCGTGNIFFVDSGAAAGGGGLAPESAKQTLAAAVGLCTADNGDVIYVLEGHAESVGASGLAINVAGITIIGMGNGSLRPTFTGHTTDAVITISAANVTLRNIVTAVDVDEVVSLISVTGANVTLDGIDHGLAGTAASAQCIQWLKATAAADGLVVKNCRHRQLTAAGSAQKWIELVGPDFVSILDNVFLIVANASTSSQLISGSTAVVYCDISRNRMLWIGATINTVINLATGSTGVISDNRIGSGTSVATSGAITGDGCFIFENYWADTAAASGLLAPVVDTDT